MQTAIFKQQNGLWRWYAFGGRFLPIPTVAITHVSEMAFETAEAALAAAHAYEDAAHAAALHLQERQREKARAEENARTSEMLARLRNALVATEHPDPQERG